MKHTKLRKLEKFLGEIQQVESIQIQTRSFNSRSLEAHEIKIVKSALIKDIKFRIEHTKSFHEILKTRKWI